VWPGCGWGVVILAAAVLHDEARADVLDRPGWREAAICWQGLKMSQKGPLASRHAVAGIGYELHVSDGASSSTRLAPAIWMWLGPAFCERAVTDAKGARHERLAGMVPVLW
jgi:hypothetical protein